MKSPLRTFTITLFASTLLAVPAMAQDAASDPAAQVEATRASVHPAQWPAPNWPYAEQAGLEARIRQLVAAMSLEEKVGQVLQADISTVTPEDVRRYHLGSVLNGGNSGPNGDDLAPARDWLTLADAFYDASMDTSDGGEAIPILWGTDAVHGHSNIVGATLFPHNVGLGAAHDPELIERIGAATAIEIRVTGQEWTFAPTVTVPQDWRWGRAYEGYSSDPALVASYVGRMIRGLQGEPGGEPVLAGPHVIASTKHYLADGGTFEGRDQGDAKIDETTLRDIHGTPYVEAIESGVETVMTSFSSWNGTKIAGHKGLVEDVLKERMNFGGFVVTDWNAHGQIANCSNASCPQALLAGIDMYMAPDSWKDLYASLTQQVRSGVVPMARLDNAVSNILRVKLRMGLFDAGRPSQRAYSGRYELLGAPEHRALAREAVRKSLVLLKNEGSALPIQPGARVLVAGDAADDIARQSGGWTLSWQGTGLSNADFPGAKSIWDGINEAVATSGGRAVLSPDGSFEAKPDVAIVVFGETPYAEFQGDRQALLLDPPLTAPWETMARLKEQGIPVVAVMVTGRPLYVNPALNDADAFVVAWLPGSEGEGVADLLVAPAGADAPRYDFTGRLPVAWPVSARVDGAELFPRGYGLTLAGTAQPWEPLPEESGVEVASVTGTFLDRGAPAQPWSLYVIGEGDDTVRVTDVPARVLNGAAEVTATDHLVQEGARRFAFDTPATVALATTEAVDLSRESNGDVLLVATIRRDTPLPGGAALMLRSGDATAAVPFDAEAMLPQGEWRTIGIPLKCFAARGANLAGVTMPFALQLTGGGTVSIARVALGTEADARIACN